VKILYISPNMEELAETYSYYSDLYNALKKMATVHHGTIGSCPFDPDVIVFGLSYLVVARAPLRTKKPTACFVHKAGVDWERKSRFLGQVDLVLSSVPGVGKLFKYAADPNIFFDMDRKKIYDVGFSGALHNTENYPNDTFSVPDLRKELQIKLKESGLNCFLNGSDSIEPRIMDYKHYAEMMSHSKIWFTTTGPLGDIGPRYYEPQLTKTLLFCEEPPQEYRNIFRHGDNCVWFDSDDFITKIKYYLENESERLRIVNKAYGEFMANHTWMARAWELLEICTDLYRKHRRR